MGDPATRLGLRLAWGSAEARRRALLCAVAGALSTATLLVVVGQAFAHTQTSDYDATEIDRLRLAVIASVALPVVVCVATVCRLSAAVRDQRLANLRTLGLTPAQTWRMAAVESSSAAGAGALLAALVVLTTGPSVDPFAAVLLVVLVPVTSAIVSGAPRPRSTRLALERARRAGARRPSLWRGAPLLVGLALCASLRGASADGDTSPHDFYTMIAGIGLTGLGLVVVVPVLVRVVADLLVARSRGPVLLLAGRRMQAQPADVTRVVAGLMIGLFLVTGARSVLAAFETSSDYRITLEDVRHGQKVDVSARPGRVDAVLARIHGLPEAEHVTMVPTVRVSCPGEGRCTAVVATCADLAGLYDVSGCTGGVQWLNDAEESRAPRLLSGPGAGTRLPVPARAVSTPGRPFALADLAELVVPPGQAGLPSPTELRAHAAWVGTVTGPPGREELLHELLAAKVDSGYSGDLDAYDFDQGLEHTLDSLAAAVLGIGLLTFVVATVDRVLTRRAELRALRLAGAGASVLRRAQWVEAVVPTTLGVVLAVAGGLDAGTAYLRLADHTPAPWTASLVVGGVAVVGALLAAVLTALATGGRLTPDRLRRE